MEEEEKEDPFISEPVMTDDEMLEDEPESKPIEPVK